MTRIPPRPRAAGKFLQLGDRKLVVRGVTYGTFALGSDGAEALDPHVVECDFAAMAVHGINAVRLYTVPPRWLLDTALRHGLRVMVGLPWEQHVDFLADAARADEIERRVRRSVRACAGHPAILCFSIGNEIPAPIVRWLGAERVEAFLRRLYRAAKAEDPDGLVTYVNYPSTEYLHLPFVDVLSFNVYLESRERLDAYIARLHNLAGDRPLLLAEVGLDSRRNGEDRQAAALAWQVRASFAAGCAGAFVFAWTDEWHRGGHEIVDWDFGLVRRDRTPKPALGAVAAAFADAPCPAASTGPRISVVCCTYNGARTIGDTMEGLRRVEYPDFEVIVVDDGSSQDVRSVVEPYGVRYIRTENRGLSAARNTGLQAATGEIVAYIDDDAWPDPHWLAYLAATFEASVFVGVGGPNVPPPDGGFAADCVARAPGGPIHVLLDDREAEHIPGCNMAFRRRALEDVGGFDPSFRVAGDDVDLCWRLQERGWTIGFSPAAMVWHHRRDSVGAYLRQQRGYGRAEAMLERKWPAKYNAAGHVSWSGRVYASYLTALVVGRRGRIYHGTWGSALFQSLYQPAPSSWRVLLMMPEYYLLVGAVATLSALGLLWAPLLSFTPFLGVAAAALVGQAVTSAWAADFPSAPRTAGALLARRLVTAALHLLQPLARLHGRVREGLTPWRGLGSDLAVPLPREQRLWSERWLAPEARLEGIEAALRGQRALTRRGGDYDRWDLEVLGGMLGGTRALTTVEEHGAGKQLTRVRMWPRTAPPAVAVAGGLAALSGLAALDGARAGAGEVWIAAAALGALALSLLARVGYECATSMAVLRQTLRGVDEAPAAAPGARALSALAARWGDRHRRRSRQLAHALDDMAGAETAR